MSIRLSPDGLSFWVSGIRKDAGKTGYMPDHATETREAAIDFDAKKSLPQNLEDAAARIMSKTKNIVSVRVMVDTPKTVLVPEEVFDREQIGDYLEVNNIDVLPSEKVAVAAFSIGTAAVKAIIVIDKAAVDSICGAFGADKVSVTSPFETADRYRHVRRRKDTAGEYATVYMTAANVYFTVQHGKWAALEYCELMPYVSPEDVMFYMDEIAARFRLSAVFLKGRDAEKVRKSLKKKIKGCKCV